MLLEGVMQKVVMFIFGAIIGGLVGSALALLLAPMSGNELRSEASGYSHQVKEEIVRAAALRRAELERELADLRREVITQ
jgi:gas vesicle protein